MKKTVAIMFGLLALAACDPPKSAEPQAKQKLDNGDVALIATAPDGTRLWVVESFGGRVYFSSSGTQWCQQHGRTCSNVQVPEVQGP